ncbi:MAG: PAS domain S-box protein, partial [Gemmatimonadaceae bacterium]
HADDRAVAERLFQEVATEPGRAARGELRVQHKNGSWRDLEVVAVNHTDDPVVDAVVVNYHDVTERKRVEAALRDSEERFRQLAEHISEAFFVTDVTTESPLYVSPAWATIWGRDLAQALDARLWFSSVHPDDQPKLAASQQATLRGETSENVFRILRPDGVTRWVRGRSYPVRDAAGVIYRRVGVVEDITELRSAEGQYLHAQKMESIGRLAGGVAHDFNNLLTVISSYVSLIIEDGKPSAPVRSDLDEIQKAADSAASLTRQLLAFSRQQVLDPKSLDVNAVVRYAEKMLRRLIGEDIEVRTILQDDAGLVLADFGQLEQVIMNLAVNARDAMPSGGSLTIETASMDLTRGFFGDDQAIQAGPFVMLAVTDSGVGMDDETRAKIFEPFFTTKEPGRGTGLGLSTVYGIVKDGGGHLFVHSEPGRGTTFKVYLPRTDARAEGPATATSTATLEGTETLLIVEDVAALRDIERRVLQRKGYKVLEAPDANAAAAVSAAYAGPIHLLLTDVVLPRTNGRELAERLRATRPEMRVLFTSGYTADAVTRLGILEHGFAFMQKPFAPDTLEHKVREVLDAAGTS